VSAIDAIDVPERRIAKYGLGLFLFLFEHHLTIGSIALIANPIPNRNPPKPDNNPLDSSSPPRNVIPPMSNVPLLKALNVCCRGVSVVPDGPRLKISRAFDIISSNIFYYPHTIKNKEIKSLVYSTILTL
jgi:hypothetical protein